MIALASGRPIQIGRSLLSVIVSRMTTGDWEFGSSVTVFIFVYTEVISWAA